MQNINKQLKIIIPAVLLLILGILFCCSLAIGISGLSVLIGIILIIIGSLLVINSLINEQNITNASGIIGVGIITFGIVFIINHLAGIIFLYIPWFLIILSIFLIVDIIINKLIKNNSNNKNLIIKIIFTIISLSLGLCLKLINGFMEYSSIVLGIIMISISIYLIITMFINKK